MLITTQISASSRSRLLRILFSGLLLGFVHVPYLGTRAAIAAKVSTSPVPQSDASQVRQPVLVELFTSEGCSDCPPADELLARLDATQFVPGAQTIVLSEHVTYWNHDGWVDPYSLDEMTQRQSWYVRRFHLDSAYTPQAVVDGSAQLIGSDRAALIHAISAAAQKIKPELRIEGASWNGNTIGFSVKGPEGSHAVLNVALAEDATSSAVGRGENAGRTLHHVAVVRLMKTIGRNKIDEKPIALQLGNGKPLTGHAYRLIAFLTDDEGGQVLAATEVPIDRP
jgi:hypothetical protein